MKLKLTHTFLFAHRGTQVQQYTAGSTVESDDPEFIATVLAEKWGTKTRTRAAGTDAGPETEGAEGAEGADADGADADGADAAQAAAASAAAQ